MRHAVCPELLWLADLSDLAITCTPFGRARVRLMSDGWAVAGQRQSMRMLGPLVSTETPQHLPRPPLSLHVHHQGLQRATFGFLILGFTIRFVFGK